MEWMVYLDRGDRAAQDDTRHGYGRGNSREVMKDYNYGHRMKWAVGSPPYATAYSGISSFGPYLVSETVWSL